MTSSPLNPTSHDYRLEQQRHTDRTNVVVGSLWMIGLTLVLFFLPLVNGLIGGFVGGYKVGSVGRALAAAVLPAIVAAFGLWALFAMMDAAGWGLLAGLTLGVIIALADMGIFLGAALGGAWRSWRRERRLP